MAAETYRLNLPPEILRPGFWLYVWRVESPEGEYLYVGRTGDSSSPNARAPYRRMGEHLGFQKNVNQLRRQLEAEGIDPERCRAFQFIAHGPLLPPAREKDMKFHKAPRNIVAAREKALADALSATGYSVLNTVNCRQPLDKELFARVLAAFATDFPKLRS